MTIFSQVWTSTLKVTSNTCTHKSVRQFGGVLAGGYSEVTDPNMYEEYKTKLAGLVGTNTQLTVHKIETQVMICSLKRL